MYAHHFECVTRSHFGMLSVKILTLTHPKYLFCTILFYFFYLYGKQRRPIRIEYFNLNFKISKNVFASGNGVFWHNVRVNFKVIAQFEPNKFVLNVSHSQYHVVIRPLLCTWNLSCVQCSNQFFIVTVSSIVIEIFFSLSHTIDNIQFEDIRLKCAVVLIFMVKNRHKSYHFASITPIYIELNWKRLEEIDFFYQIVFFGISFRFVAFNVCRWCRYSIN